jgi:hypothetical protein
MTRVWLAALTCVALSACFSLRAPEPAPTTPLPPTLPAPPVQGPPTVNAATRAVATVAANATAQSSVRVLPTEPPATARASTTPRATATVRPTVTPVPPLPKLRDWQVTTKSEQPRYEIEGSWPDLPNEVPGAAAFNALVQRQANARITSFKTDMATWEVPKDFPNGSNLGVTYSTTLAAPGFVSVRIEHYSYYAGAAHPNTDSSTLNFDLTSGQPLSLSTQFKPGSNGLKLIADFSTRELRKKLGRDLDEKGALEPDTQRCADHV